MTAGPILAPSNRNCTAVMPTLSAAVAVTVITPPLIYAGFVGAVIETAGGVVSIVTGTLAAAVFPAVSVATTLKVCDPLATPALFQETLYAGPAPVTTAPRFAPSSLNCTPVTPALSVAVAVTVITPPLTYEPFAGAVIDTVGGALSIVTETLLVAVFPAASVATAFNVCDPLATAAVFQAML